MQFNFVPSDYRSCTGIKINLSAKDRKLVGRKIWERERERKKESDLWDKSWDYKVIISTIYRREKKGFRSQRLRAKSVDGGE